jgi:hypothetical protein
MATASPSQSTNRLSAKQPDRIGGVAGEAPFRVFRYAPASPFHLTRYETKPHKPVPSGPTKGINKTNKKLATKRRPLQSTASAEREQEMAFGSSFNFLANIGISSTPDDIAGKVPLNLGKIGLVGHWR